MIYRIIFLSLLVFSLSAVANMTPDPIPIEIDSYVKKYINFNKLKQKCEEYRYQIITVKIERFDDGTTITDWMVIDNIGSKVDQRFFTFQTTNGEVTSKFKSLRESKDWLTNFQECKST